MNIALNDSTRIPDWRKGVLFSLAHFENLQLATRPLQDRAHPATHMGTPRGPSAWLQDQLPPATGGVAGSAHAFWLRETVPKFMRSKRLV
jgi:hypothetical protein